MTASSDRELAVVTTGGTIGSVLSDSVREVDSDLAPIAERVSKHCEKLGVDIEMVPAVNMLSENMEPVDWTDVGKSIKECIDSGYESVVVTHGTDTLVYSANAFRSAIGDVPAKVVFTGSFYGPDAPDNDVEVALQSSIEASIDRSLNDGVYVSFRTPESDKEAFLHRVVDIQPMRMDGMGFQSLFGSTVGKYIIDDGWDWSNTSSPTHNPDISGLGGIPDRDDYSQVTGDVQLTKAVPGQILPHSQDTMPEVLIVSLYHSGTASTSTHTNGLHDFIRDHQDDTDILLVGLSNNVVSPPYESTAKLIQEGATLVRDVQPHVIYASMYVGLANGLSVNEILDKTPGVTVDSEDL